MSPGIAAAAAAVVGACASMIEKAFIGYSRPRLEEIIASGPPEKRESAKARMEATLDRKEAALRAAGLMKAACILVAAVLGYLFLRVELGLGYGVVTAAGLGLLAVVELIPQGLGLSYAEETILRLSPLIAVLSWVLAPCVVISRGLEVAVDRLRGKMIPETQEEEIEEELKAIVSNGEAGGVLDDHARHMIESTLDMLDQDVSEIMTPRTDLVCIDVESNMEEARKIAVEAGHSRIPVFQGTPDSIVGVFYTKDLLRHWGEDAGAVELKDIIRPPYFIPESRRAWGLLKELEAEKVQIAVVLDEYGGTAGIVTVEDILEEIVGEMTDEYDPEQRSLIKRIDEVTAEVDARVHVDEINEEMDIELPEEEDFDTIAGFMIARFGHIPGPGESFEHDGVRFTVMAADDRRVERARIEKAGHAAGQGQP